MVQPVEKQPDLATVWLKAKNSGDSLDSALKDMAVVMKQQDPLEEAIEAIRSFRYLCSKQSQESLGNLLIDLHKLRVQIELLKKNLEIQWEGDEESTDPWQEVSGLKPTGDVSHSGQSRQGEHAVQQLPSCTEMVYRNAQTIESDANRACNLGLCLINQRVGKRRHEKRFQLRRILLYEIRRSMHEKVVARAEQH